MSNMRSRQKSMITRHGASELAGAAQRAGDALGIGVCVAVTDPGGHLVMLDRMDDVPTLAIALATGKAQTVASFHFATHIWNEVLRTDPAVAPLESRADIVAIGGGYPIIEDGMMIGAIGISGGTVAQDQQIAETALQSVGFEVRERF